MLGRLVGTLLCCHDPSHHIRPQAEDLSTSSQAPIQTLLFDLGDPSVLFGYLASGATHSTKHLKEIWLSIHLSTAGAHLAAHLEEV